MSVFIPPATKLGGVYWNHPVRLSVCRRARLGLISRLGIGCRGGYFVPLGQTHSIFFWVYGEWIGAWDKHITWTASVLGQFVCSASSLPMGPEKKMLIPYIYNSFRKLINSKYPNNGHISIFDVVHVITAHVICPTAELLIDHLGLTGKFSQCSMREIWSHCKYLHMHISWVTQQQCHYKFKMWHSDLWSCCTSVGHQIKISRISIKNYSGRETFSYLICGRVGTCTLMIKSV